MATRKKATPKKPEVIDLDGAELVITIEARWPFSADLDSLGDIRNSVDDALEELRGLGDVKIIKREIVKP